MKKLFVAILLTIFSITLVGCSDSDIPTQTREVEFRTTEMAVEWKYTDEDIWTKITDVVQQREIEYRTTEIAVEWKYIDEVTWTKITDVVQQREIEYRTTETAVEWKYTDEDIWTKITDVVQQREIEYRTTETTIEWKYIDEDIWTIEFILENKNVVNPNKYTPTYYAKKYVIEANPEKGFNIPYFLYIPSTKYKEDNIDLKQYLLLEGTNFGITSNLVDYYLYDNLLKGQTSHVVSDVSEQLHIPKVVPYLPKTCFKINHENYTEYGHFHALDSTVIKIDEHNEQVIECSYNGDYSNLGVNYLNSLVDIEQQIHAIVLDAQEKLNSGSWNLEEEIFVAGFSASGEFANRYTSIYPEQVKAMFAGGMFLPIIPANSYGGHDLIYQVGTFDYELLFGRPFDIIKYNEVAKMFYMGAQETNDAIAGTDTFTNEHRNIIYDIFGNVSINDRWFNSQDIFYETGGDAIFVTDKLEGHKVSSYVLEYIIDFFKSNRDSIEVTYNLNVDYPQLIIRHNEVVLEDTNFDPTMFDIFADKRLTIVGGDRLSVEALYPKYGGYFSDYYGSSWYKDPNNQSEYVIVLNTPTTYQSGISYFSNILVTESSISYYLDGAQKIFYIYEPSDAEMLNTIENLPIDFLNYDFTGAPDIND